ncbi:MAG: hypothetical protein LAO18_00255 [Acidobacteriia bacterium]|nr:hypothetical protein [Terriglobia bacterium]
MKVCCALLLALTVCSLLTSHVRAQTVADSAPAARFERKLQRVQSNGVQARPDPSPTELTEQEINAYFASGKVQLPTGVRSVVFQEQPGIVIGTSQVDFDQLKAGKNSYNPLLSVFSGVHEVVVTTHAYGARREGLVHVDSVSLDGVEVPRFVLEMFVEKYLKPKYPNIGIDSRFALPARVDAATVGLHKVTVTQK